MEAIDSLSVSLCWPNEESPFDKVGCKIVDVSYSDRIITVESPELNQLIEQHRLMHEALRTLLIGAAAIGIPHKAEREVMQECVNNAIAVLKLLETEVPDVSL